MKTNLFKMASALVLGLAIAVSCNDPVKPDEPQVEPNFPEKQIVTLAQCDTCHVSIAPNMDWEVTISGDTDWFELRFNDEPVPVASGKEGEYILDVVAKEGEDFEQRQAVLTMTMDSKEQVIAEFHRNGEDRIFNVYAVKVEDGEFVYDGDGEYAFEETSTSDLVLTYSSTFQTYFKVVANFDWRLKDVPEWASVNVLAGYYADASTANVPAIVNLRGVNSKYPLGGAEGKLVFIVDDGSASEVESDITLSLPKVEDIFEVSLPSTADYNIYGERFNEMLGDYMNSPLNGYATGVEGIKVYAFSDGEVCDWVKVTLTDEEEENVLKDYNISISVTENDTEAERSADVYVIPGTVKLETPADALQYSQYKYTHISQKGPQTGGQDAALSADNDKLANAGARFETMDPNDPENSWISVAEEVFGVGTNNYYKLTLTKQKGTYTLSYATEIWNYALYEVGDSIEESKNVWAEFATMDEGAHTVSFSINVDWEAYDMKFLVLEGENGKFAVVYVNYDPYQTIGGGDVITLQDPSCGAVLSKMDSSDAAYDYVVSEFGCETVYNLTWNGDITYCNVTIPFGNIMVDESSDWLNCYMAGEGRIMFMGFPEFMSKGFVVLKDENGLNVLVIVCTVDPNFGGNPGGGEGSEITADDDALAALGATFKKLKDDMNYSEMVIPMLENQFGLGEDNYYLLQVKSAKGTYGGFTYPVFPAGYVCDDVDYDSMILVESTTCWASMTENAEIELNLTEEDAYGFKFLELQSWSDELDAAVTFAIILVMYEPEE